jgi:hypothetical protein
VVAEHQHGPLAGREPSDRLPDDDELLARAQVGRLGPVPAGVPGLKAQPPQQRPVPVHQHLAGVGLRMLLAAHQRPPPVDADQRLLGQLVALAPVAGQQEAEAAQPPVLAGEELGELPVLWTHASPAPRCLDTAFLKRSAPAKGSDDRCYTSEVPGRDDGPGLGGVAQR